MFELLAQAVAEIALVEWIKRRRWLRRCIAAVALLLVGVLVGATIAGGWL